MIDSITNMFFALVLDVKEIFNDLFFWCFSKVLELIGWVNTYVVGLLPPFDASSYWTNVPVNILKVLKYIDFGNCLTIVISAIGIRFILNFIPFIK